MIIIKIIMILILIILILIIMIIMIIMILIIMIILILIILIILIICLSFEPCSSTYLIRSFVPFGNHKPRAEPVGRYHISGLP